MHKPLLIEIGVEELPAIPFLKELPNIKSKWMKILKEAGLESSFEFFYTNRRLVIFHKEFLLKQKDKTEALFGAPLDIAYKDGKPTNAAIGFAKKCGVSLDEVSKSVKNGKEVLYFEKSIKGSEAKDLLKDMINEFLQALSFGKSMRWNSTNLSFIRPIRWLGINLGGLDLELEIYGIKSSNNTYAHRSISFDAFSYKDFNEYFEILQNNSVLLDQVKRKDLILEQIKKLEASSDINVEIDEELLDEVVAITEFPQALLGEFDKEFLALPKEVIITSMKEHQRYFGVFNKQNEILNNFVVVSNSIAKNQDLVIRGNQKVLRARLDDAMFFLQNDLKNGLSIDGLENIQFLDKLGSLMDKVNREKSIADYLFSKYEENMQKAFNKDVKELLNRAMHLAKADLLSEMVYEFTELQGLMGSFYAKSAGEDELVVSAIKEQYLPDGENSSLPSNMISCIVALSNKIDSLVALFSIDKIPTGTKDPFALRRAVNGIIKIIIDNNLEFNIKDDLKAIAKNYSDFKFANLEQFFIDRIYTFLDINPSIIKAVIDTNERDILKIYKKVNALNSIVNKKGFREDFSTFKRLANIFTSSKLEHIHVDTSLFEKTQENELYEAYLHVINNKSVSYEQRLDDMFALKKSIDNFFDNVMVNSEKIQIKNNRLSLVGVIYKEFYSIADISQISL